MEFNAEVMNDSGEIKVTGGGGAGYPFDVLTVDATDVDADYASLDAAITASGVGDWFEIGRGQLGPNQICKADQTYVGKGWGDPADLTDYIGYWSDGVKTYGLKGAAGDQFFNLFLYSISNTEGPAGVGLNGSSMFNCYAWGDATGGDDSFGVHVLAGTNYINGGVIRGTSTGTGTGIYVESGASVYISGTPLVICDSGWEAWGNGNIYGAICTPDGRVFQYSGLTSSRRMVGWDHYTYESKILAADAFTVTGGTWFRVQGQGIADDDLSTINVGYTGAHLGQVIFITASPVTTITIKDGVGNITNPIGGDIVLDNDELVVVLLKDGANSWVVVTDPTAAGGGGYPFDTKELTVDPTDPDAQFTTVALAAAAAGAGDCIRVGAGTHTVNAVDIPSGVDLRGSGKGITILQTSTVVECVNFQGSNVCSDLTIQNTYDTASSIYAVKFEGADVTCEHVHAIATNATGSSYAWNPRSTTCVLKDCDGTASGPADHRAVSTFGGNVVQTIEGGTYDGTDYDISAGVAGDVITLNNPIAANGTIDATGTVQGEWVDATGNTHLRGFAAADSYSVAVKNTSGVTAVAGDIGYIDEAGEYKETTTAYSNVAWCVVLVGGVNNADIYVAIRGRVIVTLNGNCSAGDYLYTSTTGGYAQPLSYVRPEVFAVALTANAGGAGGTCEALLLTGTRFIPDLVMTGYSITSHATTDFVSTIATLPGGAVLTYGAVTSGAENTIQPTAASQVWQVVLHNTTRGDSAKIDDTTPATNTINLTAAVPGTWVVGDTITARSQVQATTAGAAYFYDLYVLDTVPALTRAVVVQATRTDSGSAGMNMGVSSLENVAAYGLCRTQVAGVYNDAEIQVAVLNGHICYLALASGAATGTCILRQLGYYVATP